MNWGDTIPLCCSVTSKSPHKHKHKLFYSVLRVSLIHFERHQLRDEHIKHVLVEYIFSMKTVTFDQCEINSVVPSSLQTPVEYNDHRNVRSARYRNTKYRLAPTKQIYICLLIVHIYYSCMGKNRCHKMEFSNHEYIFYEYIVIVGSICYC